MISRFTHSVFFDAKYYSNIKKRIKAPYYGEISNVDFTFNRTIFINYISQLKIVGDIKYENEIACIQLNFKMNTIKVIAYLALFIFGIWEYTFKGEPTILVLPIFLIIEYIIVLFNYVRIKKQLH